MTSIPIDFNAMKADPTAYVGRWIVYDGRVWYVRDWDPVHKWWNLNADGCIGSVLSADYNRDPGSLYLHNPVSELIVRSKEMWMRELQASPVERLLNWPVIASYLDAVVMAQLRIAEREGASLDMDAGVRDLVDLVGGMKTTVDLTATFKGFRIFA